MDDTDDLYVPPAFRIRDAFLAAHPEIRQKIDQLAIDLHHELAPLKLNLTLTSHKAYEAFRDLLVIDGHYNIKTLNKFRILTGLDTYGERLDPAEQAEQKDGLEQLIRDNFTTDSLEGLDGDELAQQQGFLAKLHANIACREAHIKAMGLTDDVKARIREYVATTLIAPIAEISTDLAIWLIQDKEHREEQLNNYRDVESTFGEYLPKPSSSDEPSGILYGLAISEANELVANEICDRMRDCAGLLKLASLVMDLSGEPPPEDNPKPII